MKVDLNCCDLLTLREALKAYLPSLSPAAARDLGPGITELLGYIEKAIAVENHGQPG